ncbi:MAG: NHL repeat-containing protein [Chitinophagales bacterium]
MTTRWSVLAILVMFLVVTVGVSAPAAFAEEQAMLYDQVLTIKDLGDGEALRRPMSVVVDGLGRILVNDINDKIYVFDQAGKLITSFGKKGKKDGQFRDTYGVAVDAQNRIYVSDTGNYRIQVFDKDGNFLSKFGAKGEGDDQFMRPGSMVVKGDRLYVADTDLHRVSVWSLDGKHLFNFGQKGTKDGQFMYPQGIAAGPDGSIYVVDGLNFRVEVFDANGKYSDKFGKQGDTEGTFARPKGIAIDQEENVYVADGLLNLVQVVDTVGEYLGKIGGESETAIFAQPYGVWFDEKTGKVYVADRGNDEIKVFLPRK